MRRVLSVLVLACLVFFAVQLRSAVKNECCPNHFQVLKAYQEDFQSLLVKVKSENVEQFETHYHDKEAMTDLNLLGDILTEIDTHYIELGSSDETVVQSKLEKIGKWKAQLKNARGSEAKKLVESIDVTL
jgi:hypothetical protein